MTDGILRAVGGTPLVELRRVVPAGTSAGANVVAALRVAGRLGPGRTVATIACDNGLKYLSTELYLSSGSDGRSGAVAPSSG